MRVFRNAKLRQLGIEFKPPRTGDAGYDLYAVAEYQVEPMQRVLVETGLHLEIPTGYVGLVKDRSSVASAGMHTLAGVIDSAYRGELKILLVNLDNSTYFIEPGQKIAQLLLVPVHAEQVMFVESLEDLSATTRGSRWIRFYWQVRRIRSTCVRGFQPQNYGCPRPPLSLDR